MLQLLFRVDFHQKSIYLVKEIRVNIASPIVAVHRHSSEEGSKEIIELLVLEIFPSRMTMALVLGTRTILLGSKTVVMSFFLSINQDRVGVGDFLEDFLRAFVIPFVP